MPKRKGALRPSAVQSLRTRHDLEYLRRDGSLSRLVVSDAQVPKDLTTVVGRLVHRGHPRPVLRRVAVKERFVQLHAKRVGQKPFDNLFLVGFKNVLLENMRQIVPLLN